MFSRARAKAMPETLGKRVTDLAGVAGERIGNLASINVKTPVG